MDPFAIITTLSVLTIIGQGIVPVLLTLLILRIFRKPMGIRASKWIASHGLLLMFIVATVATSGSLFFSEVALFTPCKDCWIQRIFMYPQVILLGIALLRRDRSMAFSILALSILGMIVSIDHYTEQWEAMLNPIENDPLEPCDLSGISCRATYIFEFGYITIPLMAMTAFLLNALGSAHMILQRKDGKTR